MVSVQEWVGAGVGVIAVVKANAYGHGLVPAARAALQGGARCLGVAIPEEAVALRGAGITAPILVMGISDAAAAPELVRFGIDAAVSTRELLGALSAEAARQGRPARVHVKIDSGMGRAGILPEEAIPFFAEVARSQGIAWAGLMTHFATADEDDRALADEQWCRFRDVISAAMSARQDSAAGTDPLVVHAANSPAICRMPETWRWTREGAVPYVRTGLLVYGVPPVLHGPCPPLTPAIALKARVTQARDVPAGTHVSYGATFTTRRPSRLAIVPLGYADGYSRALSNRGEVLLRGQRVPVAGRVCMDQFVVDATDTGAEVGDEVVLLGTQGAETITVQELADRGGTVHHEVLARLGERLPRIYADSEAEQ